MATMDGGAASCRRRQGEQANHARGRSRAGFGSELHLRCERGGRPLAFALTVGERHEQTGFLPLLAAGAVERPDGRMQEHRRLATRYDKLAGSHLAFVYPAASLVWL